jgi:proteic killer suppression protein
LIRSFKERETEKIFNKFFSRKLPENIQRRAAIRLIAIDSSNDVNDLRIPAGNRLETLGGDREGQYGIRIDEQWRICFRWEGDNACDVEITDCH